MNDRPLALITGASRGIGQASAVSLAEVGYDVVGWFRSNNDAARATEAAILKVGGRFYPREIDVADEAAVKEGYRELRKEFSSPLKAVVCSAGITRDGLAGTMSAEIFDAVIAVNLRGCFLVSREAVKAMRKHGGSIVLISSVAGLSGQPGQVNYSASKGGINAMTQALAKETARLGIRVNAVAPGYTDTDMYAKMNASARAQAVKAIPLGRPGTSEEIAAAVRFLIQESSSYITGQVLVVDGGLTA